MTHPTNGICLRCCGRLVLNDLLDECVLYCCLFAFVVPVLFGSPIMSYQRPAGIKCRHSSTNKGKGDSLTRTTKRGTATTAAVADSIELALT